MAWTTGWDHNGVGVQLYESGDLGNLGCSRVGQVVRVQRDLFCGFGFVCLVRMDEHYTAGQCRGEGVDAGLDDGYCDFDTGMGTTVGISDSFGAAFPARICLLGFDDGAFGDYDAGYSVAFWVRWVSEGFFDVEIVVSSINCQRC